jgi:uncharacterized lipoprotein YajG
MQKRIKLLTCEKKTHKQEETKMCVNAKIDGKQQRSESKMAFYTKDEQEVGKGSFEEH